MEESMRTALVIAATVGVLGACDSATSDRLFGGHLVIRDSPQYYRDLNAGYRPDPGWEAVSSGLNDLSGSLQNTSQQMMPVSEAHVSRPPTPYAPLPDNGPKLSDVYTPKWHTPPPPPWCENIVSAWCEAVKAGWR
jgi:hypothetical protein